MTCLRRATGTLYWAPLPSHWRRTAAPARSLQELVVVREGLLQPGEELVQLLAVHGEVELGGLVHVAELHVQPNVRGQAGLVSVTEHKLAQLVPLVLLVGC